MYLNDAKSCFDKIVHSVFGSCPLQVGAPSKADESCLKKLQPLGQVKDIQMPLGGIASEILVKDGDEVKMGQALMKLDAETTQKRVTALEQLQKLKLRQLELKQTELDKFILQSQEKINFLQRSLPVVNFEPLPIPLQQRLWIGAPEIPSGHPEQCQHRWP